MIIEDYVSFEVAKLLKEKGFDENCSRSYVKDKLAVSQGFNNSYYTTMYSDDCYRPVSAPTLQMAMKWLREVYHWYIFVIPRWEDVEYMPGEWEEEMVGYQYVILSVGETNRKNEQPIITALTPESAYEAGIKYCLENLI